MIKELTKLWVTTSLPLHSSQPLTAGKRQLAVVFSGALGLGIFFRYLTSTLPLADELPFRWMFVLLFTAVYIFAGLIFCLFYANGQAAGRKISLTLQILPLSRQQRWYFSVLPSLFMASLLMIMTVPPLALLGRSGGLPDILTAVLSLLAITSAAGLTIYRRADTIIILLALAAVTALLPKLLQLAVRPGFLANLFLWPILLLMGFTGYLGWYRSFTREPLQLLVKRRMAWASYLKLQWFWTKLMRNTEAGRSWMVSIAMATLLAGILIWRQVAATNSLGWFFFCAVLAVSFATEVRAASRHYRTPEIVSVKNVSHFVLSEWLATMTCAVFMGLPVLAAVMWATRDLQLIVTFVSLQLFAGSLGLLVGSLIVSEDHNLGSQFISACLASCLLFLMPKALGLTNFGIREQSIGWAGLAAICLLITYLAEYKRRLHYA
jgi:hypothetical protein